MITQKMIDSGCRVFLDGDVIMENITVESEIVDKNFPVEAIIKNCLSDNFTRGVGNGNS